MTHNEPKISHKHGENDDILLVSSRRYRYVRSLGQGAQGVVHLVEDRFLNNRLVAIKILRPQVNEEWLLAFRHEFEVLAGLAHPRLSAVHDFGITTDGHIYFSRDFIAGDDLRNATTGIDFKRFVSLAVEICRALKPLHSRGLVHGDLKPGNIICSTNGLARLIDFSFVRASNDDAGHKGTLPFMAPEVIEGKPSDGRADLYSLGATLFEIISGTPPFTGEVSQIIAGHLGPECPTVKATRIKCKDKLDKQIFKGLTPIVARLLARRPADRFPDISEVESALRALAPELVEDDPLPDYPVFKETTGRDTEIDQIHQAITRRYAGSEQQPSLVVVEGELGTGKSSLLRGIKWWAQLNGTSVAELRCAGGGLLNPIADLVDQTLVNYEGNRTMMAAGEGLLATLTRPGETGVHLDSLTQSVARLLNSMADSRRLVVMVDDLEQASSETLNVLRDLVAGVGSSNSIIFIVGCESSFCWSERIGSGQRISLPGLSNKQVSTLVKSFLGRVESRVVDRVMAHTGGNPLFVMTLLRDLAASGEGAERLERLGAPKQLETYWRDRLATLTKEARQLIEAASILGRPAESVELSKMTGKTNDAVDSCLSDLEAGGWIRRAAQGWHVATQPLANEIATTIKKQRLVNLHRQALDVETDEARRMYHFAMSGDLDRVRASGLEVSRSLESLGALSAARKLLSTMESVLDGRDEQSAVRLDLGRICLAEGDYDVAKPYLTQLVNHKDPALGRQALLLLGRLHSLRGELDKAFDCLNQSLKLAGSAAHRARAHQELANVEYKRRDLEACKNAAELGLDCAPDEHPVRADLLGVLAKAASLGGRHEEALTHAEAAISEAQRAGDRRALAHSIRIMAWVRQHTGDLAGATEDLQRAVTLNREFGDFPRLMADQRVLGDLKWWLDQWYAALGHYEESARLAGAVANPIQRLDVQIGLGSLLAKVGRFERAQLILTKVEREAARLGQTELRLHALLYLADLVASQDRIGEALDKYYSEVRVGLANLGREAILAELELEMAGWHLWRADPQDASAARQLISSAQKRQRKEEGRIFKDQLQLQRGTLEIKDGRFEEGLKQLDELTERSEESGLKNIAWQAHLVVAKAHISRGVDFLARRSLRSAEAILDQLSAGFPPEHRASFWQDVRRAEVRRLLDVVAPSAQFSSSQLIEGNQKEIDIEAQSLYRVLEFNKRLSSEHDLDHLLEAILEAAIELTGAERGLVLLVDTKEGGQTLDIRAIREMGLEKNDIHNRFSRSIAESVHLDGEPVVTIDAMGDNRFSEFLSVHELHLRSVACLPVRYHGRSLGVLYLENRLRRGRFVGRDLRVLAAFADQVAIAISQAQLLAEATKRQRELEETRSAVQNAYDRQTADLSTQSTDLKLTRQKLSRLYRQLQGEGDYHGVVGTGDKMTSVFSLIERVKDIDVPVVFVGQSGTGKDLLARVLHDQSGRKDEPYVIMNCGSLPETLIEATLFGHTKGAFSGASTSREGILAAAHGGTLYLDEIGDMSPRMQVDLLRVLQEGSYVPLGGSETIRVDIRLVTSSKAPLEELVESGRLRHDLLYRLQVVTIELPPLNHRRNDIPVLARRFLDREATQIDRPRRTLSPEAVRALVNHNWPGNVRQLEQVIRRAVVIGEGSGPIEPGELFASEISSSIPAPQQPPSYAEPSSSREEARILDALERNQWNRTRAAKDLGIPRRTFYRKIKKMGLIDKR
jgi:transcriptional regulator with GAF, ATPase, and Fis domain/serine/threonine protein kinase